MEQLNATTFGETFPVNKGERKTIIGDSESSSFRPAIELESALGTLKIQKDITKSKNISSDVSKLEWQDDTEKYTFSPLRTGLISQFSGLNENGAKFTISLTQRPKADADGMVRFPFKISGHEDMEFWHQRSFAEEIALGRLTPEQAAKSHRPEYVIDSLAVYHKSKRDNQYMTGKVCHIYRPWVKDSLGNFTWGKWEVDLVTSTLTKVFPQLAFANGTSWLVDATFGNLLTGTSGSDINVEMRGPAGYSPVSNGTVVDARPYIGVSSGTQNAKCGLYDASDDSFITGSESDSISVTGASFTEYTMTYSGGPSVLSAISYDLACIADGANVQLAYDSQPGSSDVGFNDYVGSYSFDDPKVGNLDFNRYSIYFNYDPAGAPSGPPVGSLALMGVGR